VAVLTLLAEEPMHGYQIIQELDARSGGRWRPSPGSVYPTLQLLEDEGLVTVEQREGKKVFAITDAGRAILAERAGVPPWEDLDDEGEVFATLREAAFQLGAAVMQVAHAGTDSQRQRVLELLIDARKKVYGILAEDEPDVQA
jgi:DNA-binding PadR family transcriptional regulator